MIAIVPVENSDGEYFVCETFSKFNVDCFMWYGSELIISETPPFSITSLSSKAMRRDAKYYALENKYHLHQRAAHSPFHIMSSASLLTDWLSGATSLLSKSPQYVNVLHSFS